VLVPPSGAWRSADGDMLGLFAGNRMLLGGDRRVRDGDWELNEDGSFGGVASGYAANGSALPLPEPFTGEVSEGRMSLQFTFFQNVSLELAPAAAAGDRAELALIARQWTVIGDNGYVLVLPVGADGRLSGAGDSAGCLWDGSFTVPDDGVNVYAVELSLQASSPDACGGIEGGGYRGLATMEGERLTVLAANGSSAIAIALGTEPPPADDGDDGAGDDEDDEDDEERDDDADDEDDERDRPGRRR
jgi:hypothetical protein